MGLKIGIVGLPNVGKSTLFNALLKRQQALVANYPFATIEPNVGIVEVPDERLKVLAEISKSVKIVPATVEFVDIAGLVAGAATGAGLGNKFLTHIRDVDVILQVLRDFKDSEIVKEGSVDPKTDYEVIETELILKDLETVERIKNSKDLKIKGEEKKRGVIEKLFEGLNAGKPARSILAGEEIELARDLFLLTMKKEIKVFNVSEDDPRLTVASDELYICAKVESELSSLSEEDARAYMIDLGIKESGLDKLIRNAYETLGLISFLTTGITESRAWTIPLGTKAPQAAAVIHTDFEKKFIKAKVCDYDEFVVHGGWREASEKGKVRFEGKEYPMRDGDVVEFMIGT
ncbi:redox-regulated ATPase YchF [Candidatus Collierbacteria bacterium RIFOXYB2_FULL_46_14]|uniref:GTP-binding protein YchF n=1 Tax=Candidatus Collierbacteria bacterium GW2011_GWA2_46_26 TaxID=1618381 RepID=A0A0G1PK04_9BACT|nr:MAG: GTP-binding protein YchF [Candidatus Collierbacteria bacterium GW2011_GWC2_44_13]KKU33129.1 MAG: GTP-binding protein YchF [Candidatus Collierbacteria bacterium GW2011_GWA2_46_26]OGD73392.1 MAG: redox-regulated ATPase YchF [Candidatus Collierbacteria bacterium RIFOXYB2_FULL_46_14]OGD76434.1 MAG: redox-regulated ATPase YchF [Candidatus Collierbacteria bacterium RIFOXYA2_FULL_46_20]OGD77770.1 MAG: redox-regulated ATPase YchF [Candidatus Collierbacteria bacterium RIFOXYC2_FULL_43_15]OGD810